MAAPKAKRPGIDIPVSGQSSFPVRRGDFSESFTVDFDDARKLHAFLTARQEILDAIEAAKDTTDSAEVMAFYEGVWGSVQRATDMVLGDGACSRIFAGQQAVHGGLSLLTSLSEKIGPAYDAMFGAAKE